MTEPHNNDPNTPTLSPDEARAGEKTGHVRIILGVSTLLTICGLVIVYIVAS
jgi:hypothetical protein